MSALQCVDCPAWRGLHCVSCEAQRNFDRRVNRIIAVEIAIALALTAALIVAWFLAASPASAGAVRDTTQLGADIYVPAKALRAALARLDGGAGDAGPRASRNDGGAR